MGQTPRDLTVLLSSSVPQDLRGQFAAQRHYSLLTVLAREILSAGGRIVFGGRSTVTPILHSVARPLKTDGLILYQLEAFKDRVPPVVDDRSVFREVHWVATRSPNDLAGSLHAMRTEMARRADAAIFIGGKTSEFLGTKPGIREEYDLFRQMHPARPAYLVGMLGGATAELIRAKVPEQNTLQPAQADFVHTSMDVELVVQVIVADLIGAPGLTTDVTVFRAPTSRGLERSVIEPVDEAADGFETIAFEAPSKIPGPGAEARPKAATVRFLYATGVKRPFLIGARLVGGWDDGRRPSSRWSVIPMRPTLARDGCPAFEAEVTFPVEQVGGTFRWGVRVDGPAGTDVWGIPAEVRDVNSSERWRAFDLLPPSASGGPQVEAYHLCQARRLGAQKDYPTPEAEPRFRAGVWAPNAREVKLAFGSFHDIDHPGVPQDGPIPREKVGGGYIADDGRHGLHPGLGTIAMRREGPFWFTEETPALARFAALDHKPYMFLVTRDDGSTLPRTDLYSRCQAGRGRLDPGGNPYDGPVADLDGRVSCSVVVDPDTVVADFEHPTWPEPPSAFVPAAEFWISEFSPDRPVPRRVEDLVIYELHAGALGGSGKQCDGLAVPGDFADAIGLLDHLADLGVNAIELLPMAEFGLGNAAWGYGNSHHFAIEYAAGGRDQFKHFVRACHRRGIAVILDVVYNHFSPDVARAEWMFDSTLHERNIYYWYEGHPSDYPAPDGGYVDNYSSGYAPRTHEEMVRAMFVSSAVVLVEEFHLDGFRVDLTDALHSMNRRHADGMPVPAANVFGAKFLREWTRTLKLIRPDVVLIAEDHTGWDRVTAPPDEGGLGFDATWYAEFYHRLVGSRGPEAERTGLLARAGTGGNEPLPLDRFARALLDGASGRVVYHASHDEAGNSAFSGRTMEIAVNGAWLGDPHTHRWSERRSRLVAGLSLLSAGTPLFLMGEEVAAARPYRYNDWLHHREDIAGLRKGDGAKMFHYYAALIRLRLSEPAFRSRHIEVIHIHETNRVLAFRRWLGDRHFLVVASFANAPFESGYEITNPTLPDGRWTEVLNSDDPAYGGDGDAREPAVVDAWAGRFRARLPAAGLVVFEREGRAAH